ncbi:SUN domain-containing ossification factor-like [Branchiostoma lanceolatum]|uniref:SUN domain-containing ossification factor-like n=1 Tax=Branchiostoma lanceolatum TaxID=7740 RepID=UPI003452B926
MWNGLLAVLLLTLFLNSLYTTVQSSSPSEVSAEESVNRKQQTKQRSQDCPVYLVDMTTGECPGVSYPTAKSTSTNKGTGQSQNLQETAGSPSPRDEDRASPDQPVASQSKESALPSPAGEAVDDHAEPVPVSQHTEEPVPTTDQEHTEDSVKPDIKPLKDSQPQDVDTPSDGEAAGTVQPSEVSKGSDEEEADADVTKSKSIGDDAIPKSEKKMAVDEEHPDVDLATQEETSVTGTGDSTQEQRKSETGIIEAEDSGVEEKTEVTGTEDSADRQETDVTGTEEQTEVTGTEDSPDRQETDVTGTEEQTQVTGTEEQTEVTGTEDSAEEEDLVAHKEDDMPSFDEWKKRMLEQEEREKKQNSNGQSRQSVSTQGLKTQKGRHNYGSVECGAKILSANREVQHSSSVLVENKDMYMLNPCSAKIWFIVELCEPIQLKQIDIANFELFSSVPESFKVSTSERYPAREWQLLGTLHMTNERSIQSFPLDEKLFNKYLKVEMLSHYGSEHYCPLSLFRVFGTSMEEEIEETEQHSETVVDPEDDLFPDESVPLSPDSNLFGSAKDAVLNIVKQAAKVFTGPSDGMASTEPHEAKGKVSVEKTFLEPTLEYPEPCLDINRTVNVSVPDHDGPGKESRSIQPTPTSTAHSTGKHSEISEDQTPPLSSLPLDPSLQEDTDSVQDKNSIQPTVSLVDNTEDRRADLKTPAHPADEKLSEGIVTLVESGIVEGSTPQDRQGAVSKQCQTCSELQAVQKCQGNAWCLFHQLILQTSCEEEQQISTPPTDQLIIVTDTQDDEGTSLTSNVVEPSKNDEDGDISIKSKQSVKIEPSAAGTDQVLTDPTDDKGSLPVISDNNMVAVPEADTDMSTTSPTLQHGHDSSTSPGGVDGGEDQLQTSSTPAPLEGSERTSAVQEEDSSITTPTTEGTGADGSETPVADSALGQTESETPGSISDAGSSLNGGTKQTHVHDKDSAQVEDAAQLKDDIVTSANPIQDSQDPSLPEPAPAAVQNGSMDGLDKQTKNTSDFYAEKNENSTSAQHISHGGHTGKESVIMRLNNRIKALELNMSLSSRYLEELSQRYRKQMDEMQKAFNKTISKLTNNSRKAEERDIRQQEIIANLAASITNLTADIQTLNTDRDSLHRKVIERHIFLMVVEVLCLAVVFMVCIHTRPAHRTPLVNSQEGRVQEHLQDSYTTRTQDLSPRRSDGEADKFVIVEPQCNRQMKGTDGTKKKRSKKKQRYQGLRNTSSTPNLAEQLTGHQEVAAGVNMSAAGLLFSSSTAEDGRSFSSSRDSKCRPQTAETPQNTAHQRGVTRSTLQTTQRCQQPAGLKHGSSEHGQNCQEPAMEVFLCCGKTRTSVH